MFYMVLSEAFFIVLSLNLLKFMQSYFVGPSFLESTDTCKEKSLNFLSLIHVQGKIEQSMSSCADILCAQTIQQTQEQNLLDRLCSIIPLCNNGCLKSILLTIF